MDGQVGCVCAGWKSEESKQFHHFQLDQVIQLIHRGLCHPHPLPAYPLGPPQRGSAGQPQVQGLASGKHAGPVCHECMHSMWTLDPEPYRLKLLNEIQHMDMHIRPEQAASIHALDMPQSMHLQAMLTGF